MDRAMEPREDMADPNSPLDPYEPKFDFSVIITCHFEENSIDEFYARLSAAMKSLGRSYEIIFVNDGSTDKTLEKLEAIIDGNSDVSAVIDLMKNVGQGKALTAGMVLGQGRAFVVLDSDLQLDPEEFPLLVAKYDEGYDIVSGYRTERKDSVFRKLPSILANAIMRKASATDLKDYGCTFKIYDGRLVRAHRFSPFNPWRAVPVLSQAQRIAEVPVSHHARRYGKSGWTFKKLFVQNMDNFVIFSERPFQMIAVVCLFFLALFIIRVCVAFALPGSILSSVTTGLLLNVILGGFLAMLFMFATVGEFVIRIFGTLQRRPAYIIRKTYTKRARHSDEP